MHYMALFCIVDVFLMSAGLKIKMQAGRRLNIILSELYFFCIMAH